MIRKYLALISIFFLFDPGFTFILPPRLAQLNLQKNTLAFEQLCNSLDIKCVILTRDQVPPHGPFPYGNARDLIHPGADTYKTLAHQIKNIIDGPNTP